MSCNHYFVPINNHIGSRKGACMRCGASPPEYIASGQKEKDDWAQAQAERKSERLRTAQAAPTGTEYRPIDQHDMSLLPTRRPIQSQYAKPVCQHMYKKDLTYNVKDFKERFICERCGDKQLVEANSKMGAYLSRLNRSPASFAGPKTEFQSVVCEHNWELDPSGGCRCPNEHLKCTKCHRTKEIPQEWHSNPMFSKRKTVHQCNFEPCKSKQLYSLNLTLMECTICGRKRTVDNRVNQRLENMWRPPVHMLQPLLPNSNAQNSFEVVWSRLDK